MPEVSAARGRQCWAGARAGRADGMANIRRRCQLGLVCRSADSCTKSFELGDDRIGGCGPDERFAGDVVMGHKVIDVLNQFAHRAEGAAADGTIGDESEKAFDQVEPRAVGWHEVQMPARTSSQPRLHLSTLFPSTARPSPPT